MNTHPWQRNLWIINLHGFFSSVILILPIVVPLFTSYGLSMTQIMLTQSVFSITVVLAEVPSGYLADKLGRKSLMIVGSLLGGIGFSILIWTQSFFWLCLFEMTLALAHAAVSGADTSLAYETEAALKIKTAQSALSRLIGAGALGEAFGAMAASALLFDGFETLLWTQCLIGWVPFCLSIFLIEPPKFAQSTVNPGPQLWHVDLKHFCALPGNKQRLCLFLCTSLFCYFSYWLLANFLHRLQFPTAGFGLVWCAIFLMMALATRFTVKLSQQLANCILPALLVGALLSFFITGVFWIILGAALASTLRGLFQPRILNQLNENLTDNSRATINSVLSLSFRASSTVLGPCVGWIADHHTQTMTTASLLVLGLPALYLMLTTRL